MFPPSRILGTPTAPCCRWSVSRSRPTRWCRRSGHTSHRRSPCTPTWAVSRRAGWKVTEILGNSGFGLDHGDFFGMCFMELLILRSLFDFWVASILPQHSIWAPGRQGSSVVQGFVPGHFHTVLGIVTACVTQWDFSGVHGDLMVVCWDFDGI